MKKTILGLFAFSMMSATALAADIKPAIIYDLGGKFDKSFNEAAFNGAEKFKTETGVEYREFEIANDAQREQALRRFASDGNSPIVMAGFNWAASLEKIAPEYPDIKFAIIDMVVEKPNVKSVVFKEQEGSYLVGVLAGLASKSKTVSFIGGMDVPLIHKFACGYVGGAKSTGADVKVLEAYTGTTPDAWNDPVKGGEIAKSQIDQGSDVVYHAAGGTGVGVLQAAADAGKLGIGVDSNQNGLQPGKVLTSMLKRVDVAVYEAFTAAKNDKFEFGISNLGLKEDGVGYALDDNNKALITPEMLDAVEKVKAEIIAGKVEVHDYMSDESCPY
ncbi:BMP family ABC transporter substrate-binding protein [Ensifer sp. 2YAB10]|jgi:basic membrane protein A|uniref:BMP family lipoprotein n=1 Tax=Ensifer TaxID=106591 RepID=UPI000DE376FF|nr:MULTISPECIES: BMP family ABC transporter substrate-binding protein [Ensifer]MBK5566552.1 BMP family ABC transporter substrate-binding protein [Ensifer sp. SSB1]MBZ7923915.1 BMP family ABC transporter substrate-binding protein [Ensifer adhaerens]UAX92452.1 BMP family ABC transporter substrate-binding protein [Ensifer adhaerens]UAY00087.1 BMP family ABC transporter substrate-binding protein [Ensifer adhaerens]UAY07470.1 BMP family ABC transporter substrate-binding protein [Ensifer adhaerens]